ncbi:unnamed protein product [Caenorhabditis auriculariae]|uniref:Uncharacterized protein n=1 Tax=Caenorhabditis auriculariae TaxID=2777116 RepID=A0A8S1GXQ0_9PELO|nr:unnamed protein product [Caenorhabditis auriculariae]
MSEKAAVATPLLSPPSSYWSELMMTNGLERKTPTRFEREACSRRKEGGWGNCITEFQQAPVTAVLHVQKMKEVAASGTDSK